MRIKDKLNLDISKMLTYSHTRCMVKIEKSEGVPRTTWLLQAVLIFDINS